MGAGPRLPASARRTAARIAFVVERREEEKREGKRERRQRRFKSTSVAPTLLRNSVTSLLWCD
jgi:hypothetical protein